jgi:hypothetical protein
MLRREARLRKEFLYRKALEEKEKKLYDQKMKLKEALDTNKPIPKELQKEAATLAASLSYDEGLPGILLPLLSGVFISTRTKKQDGRRICSRRYSGSEGFGHHLS